MHGGTGRFFAIIINIELSSKTSGWLQSKNLHFCRILATSPKRDT